MFNPPGPLPVGLGDILAGGHGIAASIAPYVML